MIKINKEKFKELIKKECLNTSSFANKLGVSRTQVWRILEDRSNPGVEFIAKFKQCYPTEKFEEYFFANSVA